MQIKITLNNSLSVTDSKRSMDDKRVNVWDEIVWKDDIVGFYGLEKENNNKLDVEELLFFIGDGISFSKVCKYCERKGLDLSKGQIDDIIQKLKADGRLIELKDKIKVV